jgi:hypothetical protein
MHRFNGGFPQLMHKEQTLLVHGVTISEILLIWLLTLTVSSASSRRHGGWFGSKKAE